MALDKSAVEAALQAVPDPAGGGDILTTGVARAVTVEGDRVSLVLEIDPARAELYRPLQAEVEALLKSLPGVAKTSVVMTAHQAQKPPPDLRGSGPRPEPPKPSRPPGIAHIVAVASGKGGVGKSTVTANLACALAMEGRRVGLLDADVYGPSQPRMLGMAGKPTSADGKVIDPKRNHGVTMMSMGFMVDEGQAIAWRGPKLMGALQTLIGQVAWGELDVLLVDLPPGTGDVQLTLAQKAAVDGTIIVSTPQDVALIDARKGVDMFQKMDVPVLGMVENMSTHICSNCGHEEHIFGHGGVAAEAEKLGVPLLAEIPLHLDIRVAADSGAPIVVSDPDSSQAQAFRKLARDLVAQGVA